MKTIEFTCGSVVCIKTSEGLEREVEIGPHQYRARFAQDHRGNVRWISAERNETRPGKPEIWLPERLSNDVYRALEEQIGHEDAEEQRRIVEMYDAERV